MSTLMDVGILQKIRTDSNHESGPQGSSKPLSPLIEQILRDNLNLRKENVSMAHRLKQFGGLVDRHQQESPETEISSGVPKKLDVHPPGLLKELAEQSRALVAAKAELKQARQQHMAAIEEANDWVDDLWALLDEKGSQIRDTQAKLEESEDKNATLTVKLEEKEKMIIRLRNEAGFYKTSHQSKIDFLSKRVKELEAACSKQRPVSFYPNQPPKCALPKNVGYSNPFAPQMDNIFQRGLVNIGNLNPEQPFTQPSFPFELRGEPQPLVIRPPPSPTPASRRVARDSQKPRHALAPINPQPQQPTEDAQKLCPDVPSFVPRPPLAQSN
ncbi:hypothetical protein NLI96_g926 [Meripilus lineatus]|uniref:Uncharacterized protein n=1 Tax=Meripilus lineatus TaxID=2056292 RepID=A0AAD5VGZ5_9APHY|nr:hypothetical protein NLI96_g926 [Physisporinus lineatus]